MAEQQSNLRFLRLDDSGTYCVLVFHQTLIKPTQADEEEDTCDILEAMYPLPALALLPADIDHEHLVVAQREDGLRDADCPCAGVDDVLFIWLVGTLE